MACTSANKEAAMDNVSREVTIKARHNGPYLVTGPIRLIDADGSEYYLQEGVNVALCRCGHSATKPFCDGTHKTGGFEAPERCLCMLDARPREETV